MHLQKDFLFSPTFRRDDNQPQRVPNPAVREHCLPHWTNFIRLYHKVSNSLWNHKASFEDRYHGKSQEYAQQAEDRSTRAFNRYMDMCTSGFTHGRRYSEQAIQAQKIRADQAQEAMIDAQKLLDMAWEIAHKPYGKSLQSDVRSAKNAVDRPDRRTRKRTV